MLSTVETMAISKAIKSKEVKEARKELSRGQHSVDMTVRVKGDLVIESDGEKAPTSSLLSQDFLALVLHHAGITRKHALSIMKEVAEEYLVEWTGSEEDKKNAKIVREKRVEEFDPDGEMKAMFGEMKKKLPKIPKKGAVKFKGEIEQVSAVPLRDVSEVEAAEEKVA